MKLTAIFEKVPEGYIGFVEELPGANTQGATLDEVRANLQEAVELVLEANRTLAEESLGRSTRHPRALRTRISVKRRDVIQHLMQHGCDLLREGGRHSVYVNRSVAKVSTVPRHREINDFLVRKICRNPEIPRPENPDSTLLPKESAEKRTRTSTGLPPLDPESSASTNSAISAWTFNVKRPVSEVNRAGRL